MRLRSLVYLSHGGRWALNRKGLAVAIDNVLAPCNRRILPQVKQDQNTKEKEHTYQMLAQQRNGHARRSGGLCAMCKSVVRRRSIKKKTRQDQGREIVKQHARHTAQHPSRQVHLVIVILHIQQHVQHTYSSVTFCKGPRTPVTTERETPDQGSTPHYTRQGGGALACEYTGAVPSDAHTLKFIGKLIPHAMHATSSLHRHSLTTLPIYCVLKHQNLSFQNNFFFRKIFKVSRPRLMGGSSMLGGGGMAEVQ